MVFFSDHQPCYCQASRFSGREMRDTLKVSALWSRVLVACGRRAPCYKFRHRSLSLSLARLSSQLQRNNLCETRQWYSMSSATLQQRTAPLRENCLEWCSTGAFEVLAGLLRKKVRPTRCCYQDETISFVHIVL